jgi:hypothetical protein
MAKALVECDPVWLNAEDPLFMLYTRSVLRGFICMIERCDSVSCMRCIAILVIDEVCDVCLHFAPVFDVPVSKVSFMIKHDTDL